MGDLGFLGMVKFKSDAKVIFPIHSVKNKTGGGEGNNCGGQSRVFIKISLFFFFLIASTKKFLHSYLFQNAIYNPGKRSMALSLSLFFFFNNKCQDRDNLILTFE